MCSACQKNSKGPALRTKFRLSIIERSLITLHRSVDLLYVVSWPIQVAARSEAWVCGSSLAGIVVSNPTWGQEWLSVSLVRVVYCRLDVPATGRLLVRRSITGCGLFGCDRGMSTKRTPWSTKALQP